MAKTPPRRNNRLTEPEKNRDLAEKVNRLMECLAEGQKNQAGLAEKLEVSQQTISAWLRADKRRPPSAHAYFRMASIAPDIKDKVWFLRAAGLDDEAIQAAGAQVLEKAIESGLVPKMVVISTRYGGMFCAGEVVSLDESGKDSQNLMPFWDKVVLVKFAASRGGQEDQLSHWRHWPSGQLWIARLRLKRSARHTLTYLAILECEVSSWDTWEPRDEGICIGGWNYKTIAELGVSPQDKMEAQSLARSKVRLYNGCKILATVTRWLPSVPVETTRNE